MRSGDSRRGRWGGAALASAALVAYAATAALLPLDNNDIWIHLTTGGLILDEGAVPRTDRYSFTAAGNRYVAHEWLAAALYATAERSAGIPGVVVVAKLLPTLAIPAMLWAAQVYEADFAFREQHTIPDTMVRSAITTMEDSDEDNRPRH